jgi:acetyl/propionyl-CoA carboxylase alpha subunit
MTDITRLAILERGEPAVRTVAAVGDYNRTSGRPAITTVLAHTDARPRPWYAREADEALMLRPGEAAVPLVPPAPGEEPTYTPADTAASLKAAGCDAVWIGSVPCHDHAGLVTACEQAGMLVVGPSAAVISTLSSASGLARVLSSAGVAPADASACAGLRSVEVDILADAAGTIWTLPARDVSVRSGDTLVLSQTPVPGLSEAAHAACAEAARAIAAAASYVGAGVVRLLIDPATDAVSCVGVDTVARAEHSLAEEVTGASFTGLRLRIALGESLAGDPPVAEGHAVAARLLAQDPDAVGTVAGGSVEMLALPVGTGVRVDAGIREGDHIDSTIDPVIATITAWGKDAPEALARLSRAVERTTVVLELGASNRSGLLALLGRPEVAEGVPCGWYDARIASGDLVPTADPVALLAAAIEAYEADLSMVRAAFFASAERGRPEHPEAVGSQMSLTYRGVDYRIRVDRTAPGVYRIHDGATLDVSVDSLGEFERRITVGGRRRAIVAIEQGADFRIEIDGVAHTVTRGDGVVVRTGWPALVAQVLVEPGQQIRAGDPVAVLESMKMVSTVVAPFDGVVASLAVIANAQVERGAPLLRIRAAHPAGTDHGGPAGEAPGGQRVDLTPYASSGDSPTGKDCTWVFERLVNYLLGYDLDPGRFRAIVGEYTTLAAATPPGDAKLLACEDALLDLFGDIGSLYRPRVEDDERVGEEETAAVNTQEYFIAFLQWLDADRAGLPVGYRSRLERALGRYGVRSLKHTKALEEAMVWMFRSFARVPELAPVVSAILQRRLENHAALAAEAGPITRQRMERLVWASEGRQQLVADLARDVIFHYYDEPVMESGVAEVQREMAVHLAALREDPNRSDRGERIGRLVWCPHPMRGMLLEAWQQAGDDESGQALRAAILEVYAYRFYRMRSLSHFTVHAIDGVQIAAADYPRDPDQVHLVVAYLPLSDLEATSRAIAAHVAQVPAEAKVVVDVVTWTDGLRPDIDTTAEDLRERAGRCDFGRPLHRLDFTITYQSADAARGNAPST